MLIASCSSGEGAERPGASDDDGAQQDLTLDPEEGGEEFQALVAAAQEEGKLLLNTPVGQGFDELGQRFGEKFGIDVEVNQGRVADQASQVLGEREAGQYTVDVWYSTYFPMMNRLMPAGAMAPLPPVLVHEDALDDSKWQGGGIRYVDEGQEYLPVISRMPAVMYSVNTDSVAEEDWPTTIDELVNFEGDVATSLPGSSGDEFHLSLLYVDREDALETLAARQPTQIADNTQAYTDLARGRYDLVYGGEQDRALGLMEQGLPIQPVTILVDDDHAGLETNVQATPALAADAPNPNAAALFINWILTQEGSQAASEASGTVSFRTDVSSDHLPDWLVMDQEAADAGRYAVQGHEQINTLDADRARLRELFNY